MTQGTPPKASAVRWATVIAELEQDINATEQDIAEQSARLLDMKERLFLARTQIPELCPWCGEDGCTVADGACIGAPPPRRLEVVEDEDPS